METEPEYSENVFRMLSNVIELQLMCAIGMSICSSLSLYCIEDMSRGEALKQGAPSSSQGVLVNDASSL